jgi:hypothetical protein
MAIADEGYGRRAANPHEIQRAEVAQSVEHRSEKPGVTSSILVLGIFILRKKLYIVKRVTVLALPLFVA